MFFVKINVMNVYLSSVLGYFAVLLSLLWKGSKFFVLVD